MSVTLDFTELADEFALVPEVAAEAGLPAAAVPRVRRGWVNVPTGGHVSGVFWGSGAPEVVFLHDSGASARAWDSVAVALAAAPGHSSVAVDLPGHGRSDWRRDGRYQPVALAPAVAEAVRSFAPRARLVVGSGLGGLAAIAARKRNPGLLHALALVNTLPGATADRTRPGHEAERFASQEEAFAVLAARKPGHSRTALRREVLYELERGADSSWAWRHHPGNLPAPGPGQPAARAASAVDDGQRQAEPAGPGPDPRDEGLWAELAALTVPVALVTSDAAGPVSAADLSRLRHVVRQAEVVTISEASADIAATQPLALAAAIGQFLAEPVPAETTARPPGGRERDDRS